MNQSDFFTSGLRDQIKAFLKDTGRASGAFLHNVETFLSELRPLIDANAIPALQGNHTAQVNLNYLADEAVFRISRLGDDFKAQEMEKLNAIVRNVVTTFLSIALNAVAPGLGTAAGQVIGAAIEAPAVEPTAPPAPTAALG